MLLHNLWQALIVYKLRLSSQQQAGQGLIEYALIMVFVAVLVMVLLVVLGPAVSNMFQTVYESMVSANS